MRAAPIAVLLLTLILPACRSDPEPAPPPDRFEDVMRNGPVDGNGPPLGLPSQNPMIRGRVTAVDSALNIVILSVGRDDAVHVGYVFTVFRGDEYVTKLVVDKVEAAWCSGYSVREMEKSPPVVGDVATTRF